MSQKVYYNGTPVDREEARLDLLRSGYPERVVREFMRTAVVFEAHDVSDEARGEHGRWTTGGGSGGAVQGGSRPGSTESKLDVSGAGKDIEKAIAGTPASVAYQSQPPQGIVGKIASAGNAICSTSRHAAETLSAGLRNVADWTTHVAAWPAALMQVAAFAKYQGGGGRGDAYVHTADAHYDKMVKEYGHTTANLIAASGHIANAAMAVGIGFALGTISNHLDWPGNPLGHAVYAGGAVGTLGRYLNVGRAFTRYPATLAANFAHRVLGSINPKWHSQSQIDEKEALKLKAVTEDMGKRLGDTSAKMSADDALFAAIQAQSGDGEHLTKDQALTLDMPQIKKLAKLYDTIRTYNFVGTHLQQKDWWNQTANNLLKSGAIKEEDLRKVNKANMSVYLDNKPTPWGQAVQALAATGFSMPDAERYAEYLEPVFVG